MGLPNAMSINMAVTLGPGRVSRRISANFPTSTERSRVCSPGLRILGSGGRVLRAEIDYGDVAGPRNAGSSGHLPAAPLPGQHARPSDPAAEGSNSARERDDHGGGARLVPTT